jgi:DNA-binding NtrC family response regulator
MISDNRREINELKKIIQQILVKMRQLPVNNQNTEHPITPDSPLIIDSENEGITIIPPQKTKTAPATIEIEKSLSLQENEKEIIIKALLKHKGVRKKAAEELGISERTLYRKIHEYKLDL